MEAPSEAGEDKRPGDRIEIDSDVTIAHITFARLCDKVHEVYIVPTVLTSVSIASLLGLVYYKMKHAQDSLQLYCIISRQCSVTGHIGL